MGFDSGWGRGAADSGRVQRPRSALGRPSAAGCNLLTQENPSDVYSVVELELDSGEVCRGVLTEATSSRVTVTFPASLPPLSDQSVSIGAAYWLSFQSGWQASTVRILARAAFRGEDEQLCRYRFLISFEDSIGLTTLIEHRGVLRVRPPEGLIVPVQVAAEGGRAIAACLEGVSLTGISICFAEDPDPFASESRLLLRLRLPDQAETIDLTGCVHWRCATADGQLRYGLEFELGRAVAWGSKQALIEAFIASRMVEVLGEMRRPAARR